LAGPVDSGWHLRLRPLNHGYNLLGQRRFVMAATEQVIVTLPLELVARIDRLDQNRNRSRFIAEAIEHELGRRRRDALHRSLQTPHVETAEFSEAGLSEWGAHLPTGDEDLVDSEGGRVVRWVDGQGWVEETE